MSNEISNNEKPAFPLTDGVRFANDGLTKREYYAGLAMQSLIAKTPLADRDGEFSKAYTQEEINTIVKDVCESAVYYADAILKQLEK